ncbi:MAG: homoserine kinase [Clostridiales bacterium]|jgi:homoserine kinase|nr:homoserine kinase [Clostridiales bacterium]
MIKIKVPSTTANLGPGFDCLGLALDLYQEVIIDKATDGQKQIVWEGDTLLPDDQNLVAIALERALSEMGAPEAGYRLTMCPTEIPISRGMGSSAAAIVAGLYAANYLLDGKMSKTQMVDIACDMEGHPDNVVAVFTGNLSIALMSDGKPIYSTIGVPDDIVFKAIIPDFPLKTSASRKALPDVYTRAQCVHNISRVSLLIHAFHAREYALLKTALHDEIHEPYRLPLIEGAPLIFEAIKSNTQAYGAFISGAGPTLMAITSRFDDTFDKALNLDALPLNHRWKIITLQANKTGATYEYME